MAVHVAQVVPQREEPDFVFVVHPDFLLLVRTVTGYVHAGQIVQLVAAARVARHDVVQIAHGLAPSADSSPHRTSTNGGSGSLQNMHPPVACAREWAMKYFLLRGSVCLRRWRKKKGPQKRPFRTFRSKNWSCREYG